MHRLFVLQLSVLVLPLIALIFALTGCVSKSSYETPPIEPISHSVWV